MNRIKMAGFILSLCAAGTSLTTVATEIPDGGSATIDSSWKDYLCKGDATLSVEPTDLRGTGANRYYFTQTSVTATNGTLTLDFSKRTDHPVLFSLKFRADQKGKVIFKGAGKMLFGASKDLVEPCYIANDSQLFGFADAEVLDGFLGVEFVNLATLACDMGSVPWSVRDGATLMTLVPNAFASSGYQGTDKASLVGDDIRLDNFDVCLMATNVFPTTATITVGAGRTLHVKSMVTTAAWGVTSGGTVAWVYPQDIVLETATSRLFPRCANGVTLAGDISGPGYLETYEDNGTFVSLKGSVSFAGPLLNNSTLVKADGTIVTANITFDSGTVAWTTPKDVRLGQGMLAFLGTVGSPIPIGTLAGFDCDDCYLLLPETGMSLSVAKVKDRFCFTSDSRGRMLIAAAEMGTTVKVPATATQPTVTGVPVATRRTVESDKTMIYYLFDGATVSDADASVTVPSGMSLSFPNGAASVELAGGSASIGRDYVKDGRAYVAAHAMLWLDPSETTSVQAFTNAFGAIQGLNGNPYLMEWFDQSSKKTWFVAQYRGLGVFNEGITPPIVVNGDGSFAGGALGVYPFYRTDYLNGLPIVDFLGNTAKSTRAMIFKDKYTSPSSNDFKPAFCIMVYGSHPAGGSALLANPNGDFARSTNTGSLAVDGLDKPLIADNNNKGFEAWVNGEKVNVKDTNLLSGGWDVVSIDTKRVQVTGLGYAKSNTGDGMSSSQYAEIVFLPEIPSDADRLAIELYLADKWGLTGKIAKPQVTANLSGEGSTFVVGDVKLGGFLVDSRISVAEGAKVTYDAVLPATQADVATITDCVAWFDPSDPSMLTMSTGKDSEGVVKTLEVSAVSNRIAGAKTPLLVGNNANSTSSRCPWLNTAKRAYRSGMNWLDYSNRYAGDTAGDYMFFANKIASYSATSFEGTSGRMAFIVSDSVRGGGTPIFDAPDSFDSNGPNGLGKIKLRKKQVHTASIWPKDTGSEVTGGRQYLNGDEVDGSTAGFTGAPEVFAFSSTGDLNFGFQGCYSNSEKGNTYGEFLGESLYFSRVLTENERNAVTSYLMWKWLGRLPAGYTTFGEATLSGAGTISGVPVAALPQLSDDFTGTVELTESTLAFGISKADEPVTGAITASGATLALPATVTVNVTLEGGRLRAGAYTLIDVAALSGITAWSLNLDGTSDPNGRAKLVVMDGKVVLQIAKGGFIAIVK